MTEDGSQVKTDEGKGPVILDASPSKDPQFHDLYPARRSNEVHSQGGHIIKKCENDVIYNLEKMPMVKTLIGALEGIGCPIELERHIACEICMPGSEVQHAGGYDEVNNQVFVCANNCTSYGSVHGALVNSTLYLSNLIRITYRFVLISKIGPEPSTNV